MMGLQYRNTIDLNNGTGGYPGEWFGVSSGRVDNWTNTNGGSYSYSVYYTDSDAGNNNNSTRVQITGRDEITNVVRDENTNRISFHLKTVITEVKRYQRRGYAGSLKRKIDIFDREGGRLVWSSGVRPVNEESIYFSGNMVVHDQNVTIEHGQNWANGSSIFIKNNTYFANGQPCTLPNCYDYVRMGLSLRNTLPAAPYAPAVNFSCAATAGWVGGNVNAGVTDWGCPAGNSCHNTYSVDWATDANFSNVILHGTGDKALSPNTKYYTRVTATNGHKTTVKTCSFTTLASSSVYNYKFISNQVSTLTVNANYGSGACAISTDLFIREKGTANWVKITTTAVHGTEVETLRNIVTRGKRYEAKTETTNCVGKYTSPVYEFAPPAADSIVGVVAPPESELDGSGLSATAKYCYTVTAYTLEKPSEDNPISSHLEYREKGQKTWEVLKTDTSTYSPVKHCGVIEGLSCGTTYEFRSYQKIGNTSSYSPVVLHDTPKCADVENCVCETLGYMTALICQELQKLKTGRKDVFANCQTKELCDPYSQNPTFESILSRIIRFAQMAACITCALQEMKIANGEDDQIYTATTRGQFGEFLPIAKKVSEGDDAIVSSKAVKEAMAEYINGIWHIIGIYGFFAESLADLKKQGGATKGDTAVVNDKYYTYNGSQWVLAGAVPNLGEMASISILKGDYGQREFYWWDEKWNIIDVDTTKTEKRLKSLEDNQPDAVFNKDASDKYNMMVAPISYTNAQIAAVALSKYPNQQVTVFLCEGGDPAFHCMILDKDVLDGSVGLC